MAKLSLLLLFSTVVQAYPWVPKSPGVDNTLLERSRNQPEKRGPGCPFNPNHGGAAPYNSKYPYQGARNGLPATNLVGGNIVPAQGDAAHAYKDPTNLDIRGPCPGLNALANHAFLSRDGITNFQELVDAQQNVYNVGYDLAVLLAVLGVSLDGDILTGKLSIGCDATERTSAIPLPLFRQPGLNGHNKFESDSSLTRNDYFLANGDDYSFNGTLFGAMKAKADAVSGGKFDRAALAAYRSDRYEESKATNPNFYFGPKSLLLYGAATFLYELFPSLGPAGPADLRTISSFFGAVPQSGAPGGYAHVGERIPADWRNRQRPYTVPDVAVEIVAMYATYPKLFGGNVGVNNFNALGTFGQIRDGKLPVGAESQAIVCLLYQLATENVPDGLGSIIELPLNLLIWVTGKLNPVFKNYGCPLKII